MGKGLGSGVEIEHMHRRYRKLHSKDPRHAREMLRIWSGGWWPEQRRFRDDPARMLCSRCQLVHADEFHHLWECIRIDHTHPDTAASQHLVPKALSSGRQHAAYWARGVLLTSALPVLQAPIDWDVPLGMSLHSLMAWMRKAGHNMP